MDRYLCKECGKEATVDTNGAIWRSCEHKGTILLDMTVTCYGEGGMTDKSRLRQIVDLIIAMIKGKPA
jgi:ribosomal protein L37AE/L43A